MTKRQELLHQIADQILSLPNLEVLRVAVDGVDGAGKTIFADELAVLLLERQIKIIRATVDGFHNQRAVRYARGRHSPDGFYLDSYNYNLLRETLLDPISPGGTGWYRTIAFNHATNSAVVQEAKLAVPGSALVFDGIFIHRPELSDYWDFSIFLDVPFEISMVRCALRDKGSEMVDLDSQVNRRYIDGQRRYLSECHPRNRATIVIDNSNIDAPFIVYDVNPPVAL